MSQDDVAGIVPRRQRPTRSGFPEPAGRPAVHAREWPSRDAHAREHMMVDVTYRIVEHDGGWAYKLGDVFSETFPTREAAVAAARRAATEQEMPGPSETIEFQDERGNWHREVAPGGDRPDTEVLE
jgi:hypothetical protein